MHQPDRAASAHYLATIQSYPVLSREQELALLRSWHDQNDERARDLLVRSMLRYVVVIARRHQRYGVPLGDLIAEGNYGVVRALSKYDPERGTLFMSYASYWIRACILQHVLRSWSIVGSGAPRSKLFFKVRRERAKLAALIGDHTQTEALLAERLNVSPTRVRALLQRVDQRDYSLDAEASQDGALPLVNTLPFAGLDQEQLALAREYGGKARAAVREALTVLDERERYIVENRLLADSDAELSLAEIGRTLGVSRERARQLEERAKRKLKATISARPGAAGWLDAPRAA